jgi:hypothetical protein
MARPHTIFVGLHHPNHSGREESPRHSQTLQYRPKDMPQAAGLPTLAPAKLEVGWDLERRIESAPKPATMFCLNHSSITLLGLDLRTSPTRPVGPVGPVGYETVVQGAGETALKVIDKVKCCQPG